MLAGSIADTKLSTISTAGKVSNSATTATASNNIDTIVTRNGSGSFAATVITSDLTGNVFGNVIGNTTGYHTGDVEGSVFADDSSLLVDGVAGKIVASYDNSSLSIVGSVIKSAVTPISIGAPSDNQVIIGSEANPNTLVVYANNSIGVFENIAAVGGDIGALIFKTSRGSQSARTTVVAGDLSVALSGKVFTGTQYEDIGAFYLGTDPAETLLVGSGYTPSVFGVVVKDSAGADKSMSFNSKGILDAPVLKTTVYSAAGTAIPNAATMGQGARAFVSDATVSTFATAYTGGGANKVPVYSDGTVWRIG
jgi:hypothetical protein